MAKAARIRRMTEPVINNTDMFDDMQDDAVKWTGNGFDSYSVEVEIASFIKKEFDKKYGPPWHCIVGRNFGSYVTNKIHHFMYMSYGDYCVLLFKAPPPD